MIYCNAIVFIVFEDLEIVFEDLEIVFEDLKSSMWFFVVVQRFKVYGF